MAEVEPPQTPDLAVRALIGLFILGCVLHGFDVMRPEGIRSAVGWWIGASALGVFDWYWVRIKNWLGPRFAETANNVATDFRWWVAPLLLVVTYGIGSDVYRWMSAPIFPQSASDENAGQAAALQSQLEAITRELDDYKQQLKNTKRELETATNIRAPAAPAGSAQATETDEGPLSWSRDLQWSTTGDAAGPIFLSILIDGRNVGRSEVQLKDAYIVSGITGTRRIAKIDAGPDGKILPSEMNPIPPGATVRLWIDLANGLHEKELLEKWGTIYLHLEYDDMKYTKLFDENYMANNLGRFPNPARGPHVTKKTSGE